MCGQTIEITQPFIALFFTLCFAMISALMMVIQVELVECYHGLIHTNSLFKLYSHLIFENLVPI